MNEQTDKQTVSENKTKEKIILRLDNLRKEFSNVVAVDNLSLDIPKGEFFCFLGPNGAGKTTTIKMITGLIQSTQGRILIDDIDIQKEPEKAKMLLGYVPDNPYLYEKLTAREFLHFVGGLFKMEREEIEKRTNWLLDMFGMSSVADQRVESYSHGMRQKIVMSSAILHKPKILIIDEPMVGLDPQSARLVKDIFRRLVDEKGTTIFMSTHTLSIAEELCDRIGIIQKGKLLALGTLEELHKQAETQHSSLEDLFLSLTGGIVEAVLL